MIEGFDYTFVNELRSLVGQAENQPKYEPSPTKNAWDAAQEYLESQKPRLRLAAQQRAREISYVRIDCRDRTLCNVLVEVDGKPAYYRLSGNASMLTLNLTLNGMGSKELHMRWRGVDQSLASRPPYASPIWGSQGGELVEWIEIVVSW
jgi:hypothetical protein